MNTTDNTFSFDAAEDSSGFLLWQVTNLWQREIKKALEAFNLTHSQYVLLASTHWYALQKQEVTQILLSVNTKIDPMTTSTVLRTLQKKGLIKREEHLTDTRAKTVVLTDAGKEVIKEAVKVVEKFDSLFFEPVKQQSIQFNKSLLALLKQ